MKKILILLLFSLSGYTQTYNVVAIDSNKNIPRYLVDSAKDTVGIVLTMEQAQKVDNDLDLLNLYRKVRTNCDSAVNFLVQVVDDYKKLNILAQKTFREYDTSIKDLKLQINNLNKQVAIKEEQIILKDSVIKDENTIISINKSEIKHLKKQKVGLLITIGSAIIYIFLSR